MAKLTPQEIFDRAAVGILSQGARSVKEGSPFCVYRGRDGLKCAVGHLIPDALYSEELEKSHFTRALDMLIHNDIVGEESRNLLCDLRSVHDSFGVKKWPSKLAIVAYEHDLSPASISGWLNG